MLSEESKFTQLSQEVFNHTRGFYRLNARHVSFLCFALLSYLLVFFFRTKHVAGSLRNYTKSMHKLRENLYDKQEEPTEYRLKRRLSWALSLFYVMSWSVCMSVYAYQGDLILTYPDIIFCLPLTHKRRIQATKSLVLSPVLTYRDVYSQKNTPTRSVVESFLPVHTKTLNMICVSLRLLWTNTYHPKTCQCVHQICSYRLGRWLQWDPFHHSYCGMLMTPNHLS